MNKCKCGQEPKLELDLQCGCANWFIKCPECLSHTTKSYKEPKDAISEWNALNKNFPTCDTCEHFIDTPDPHICTLHDRGTEATWTCPDHMEICHEKEYAKAVTFGKIEVDTAKYYTQLYKYDTSALSTSGYRCAECGSVKFSEQETKYGTHRVICNICEEHTAWVDDFKDAWKAWINDYCEPIEPPTEQDQKDLMDKIKADTEEYTHSHNKNLLDTHFGASSGELLQGLTIRKEVDYKAEFLKLEKDYFEDVADLKADLKKEQDKACYWFEKHNEAQENVNIDYWYKEWKKAAEENEKLTMLLAKIKEIVEG